MCGGKDRYRFDDQDGTGSWFCNRCGGKQQTGDQEQETPARSGPDGTWGGGNHPATLNGSASIGKRRDDAVPDGRTPA